MSDKPRFERPASEARPHGAHRYDVFGPKVGREVTLFGLAQLHAWIMLEVDPSVETYCERPLVIPGSKRSVDFWFMTRTNEGFILLLKQSERGENGEASKLPKAVSDWMTSVGEPIRLISPEANVRGPVFENNWRWIIQDVSAFWVKPRRMGITRIRDDRGVARGVRPQVA